MSLVQTLKNLPDTTGVYQYFDSDGHLLYVGKAKSLKKRLRSYWRFTPSLHPNPAQSPRILKMLQEAKSIEYIVVESESDALILENSLIKQLKPKYNILLRDDKTYPYIYIDESLPFPRFELTRRVISGKKIKYYGPFPNGAKELLEALYEIFPLVQKSSCLKGKKACLFYQIKRCLAPCEGKIDSKDYKEIVQKAKDAINNLSTISSYLENKMLELATQERFEEASKVRDQINVIKAIEIHSDIDLARDENCDIFAIDISEERGVVVRLFIRAGKISASSYNYFRHTEFYNSDEAYRQALLNFYQTNSPQISSKILLAHKIADSQELSTLLSQRLGRALKIFSPQRGSKAKLVRLALNNAKELLRQAKKETSKEPIQERIAKLFNLDKTPWRVEAFDNSHLMGEASVGAMVVWDEDKWDKKSYRRYKLQAQDEYHQMMEMLERRIGNFDKEPPPELWLIDGGKTLRDLAVNRLNSVGVNIPVLAIAKEKINAKAYRAKGLARDILYSENKELHLSPKDPRLQWLQRLRDEAHRFAISYHRRKKREEDKQILLLEQKGIGRASLKKLLNYFGTFEEIKNADEDTLSKVVDKKIAKLIHTLRT